MENCSDRRRQAVNTSGFSGLRRSRSVRASLRKLGDRWKSQPKNGNQKTHSQTKPNHQQDKVILLDSSPEVAGKKAKNNPKKSLDDTSNCVQHLNLGFHNESTEGDWITALEFTKTLDSDTSIKRHLRQHSLDGSLPSSNRRSDPTDPDFDIRKTEYYRRNREFLDANMPRTLDHKKSGGGDSRRIKKLGYFFGSADLETHQVYFSDRHEKSFGEDAIGESLRIPRAVTLTNGRQESRQQRQQYHPTATVRTTSMWTSSKY